MSTNTQHWFCKIGPVNQGQISDIMLRNELEKFLKVHGSNPTFIFSGFEGKLSERELAVVENRKSSRQDFLDFCEREEAHRMLVALKDCSFEGNLPLALLQKVNKIIEAAEGR